MNGLGSSPARARGFRGSASGVSFRGRGGGVGVRLLETYGRQLLVHASASCDGGFDLTCQLAEQFHEREVLMPMALALVVIADRARQKCDRIRKRLSKRHGTNKSARLALKQLIEAREADLVEIENTLSVFGVESYERHEDHFDAALQKCIERVTCDDPQKHMKIARCLLPGYRREKRVIRPELVSVYFCSSENS